MKLFLFTTDLELSRKAQNSDIDSVLVDWEIKGKETRQQGHNLEINKDTPEDVLRLSQNLNIPVTVRVNPIGDYSKMEINTALDNGAKVIMLPMSKTINDVKKFIEIVDGRAKTLIQVETAEMVSSIKELKKLQWDYAHVGLNDLMLAKQKNSIWDAVADGTVEEICNTLHGRKYGFGGVTILNGGRPIPFNMILSEMVTLECSMGILRRSFKAEISDRNMVEEIKLIRQCIKSYQMRGQQSIIIDHKQLIDTINKNIKNGTL